MIFHMILLLLLKLYIKDISCNDKILSKFLQHDYKIRDYRLELFNYSQKYFRMFEVKTSKHNRTTPAVNATFNMKITVDDQLESLVQGFKFLSNEYRYFPVRFQISVKKALEANAGGLGALKNCGNVSIIYFKKDVTYHICNFVIDETQLPPLIPNGRYRFDSKLMYLEEEIAWLAGYGEVYTPIAYPKN